MTVPLTDTSEQETEVWVSGPGDANRMFIVNGIARMGLEAADMSRVAQITAKETFTLLVGPELTKAQFVRAVATATPNGMEFYLPAQADGWEAWSVNETDADFDDETGRTQLRIEAQVTVFGRRATMTSVSYQATILAAL